jgi:hypothetical protein
MSTLNTTTELVHLTAERGVSTITLDSPRNRNALSAQLRTELLQLLEEALRDESTRVIVLTHTGSVFCAGADLKEARSADTTQSGGELIALLEKLMTSDKPVVARLAGPARAGGIGLVAACDFAIAADTVTFGFSEVRIGVIPSIISVPLRLRVLPPALHRLFLTGETFDAHHGPRQHRYWAHSHTAARLPPGLGRRQAAPTSTECNPVRSVRTDAQAHRPVLRLLGGAGRDPRLRREAVARVGTGRRRRQLDLTE